MRRLSAISVFVLAALFAAESAGAQAKPATPPAQSPQQKVIDQAQTPQIITRANVVKLVATVMDRRHGFVTDLNQKDFEILEDGRPQRTTLFFRQTDLPLRVGVLLDTSNSIRERLHFEKDAAIDFLYHVIRRGQDKAFVMTFDNEPEVIQDYTDDLDLLGSMIQQQNSGGGTALDDAIYAASQKLEDAPPVSGPNQNQDFRRVIVLISDGEDTLSDRARSDAIEMADKAGVSIYSISTNNDWVTEDTPTPEKLHMSDGEKILAQFSDETGGRVFFPYRVDDLAQSFLDIGNELRSQYLIGYPPPYGSPDGQFHTIEVKVVNRKGLTVRTRKGYYAVAPPAPPASGTGSPPKQ